MPKEGIDQKLVGMINKHARDYYHKDWKVSLSQYKAWIALITLREAGYGRYTAHSQSKLDSFDHKKAGGSFRFSTGIGAFQLDHGGTQGNAKEEWGKMPTIEKIDPEQSLLSVLRWHKDRFKAGATLDVFSKKSAWCAVWTKKPFKTDWRKMTGCTWNKSKGIKKEVGFNPPTVNDPFRYCVEYKGKAYWNLWKGYFDTWLISPRSWSGKVVTKNGYYYTYDKKKGLEEWVWNDSGKKFIYRFERKYKGGRFPKGQGRVGVKNIAGVTDTTAALDPTKDLLKKEYKVVKGDTLWKIARRYKTTVYKLQKLNGIDDANKISENQIIRMGYKVKRGDTVGGIAVRLKIKKDEILKLNSEIKSDEVITVGQILRIPELKQK